MLERRILTSLSQNLQRYEVINEAIELFYM